MKDFYDVFTLSKTHDFDGQTLQAAIRATFRVRKTDLPDNPLVFRKEFHNSAEKQKQWSAFLRKTKLKDVEDKFSKIMTRISGFLKPVVFSIDKGEAIVKKWSKKSGKWEQQGNL